MPLELVAPEIMAPELLALRDEIIGGIESGRLKPRFHAGVGFAQVYLTEDVRLHLWHPSLPTEPEAFGTRHNHRFRFRSTVLLGAVINTSLDMYEDEHGQFVIYKVQPAHLGPADPILDETAGNLYVNIDDIAVFRAGETYTFPIGHYHESRGHGVTVTVMRKFEQSDEWAGILALRDQVPMHGMQEEKIKLRALSYRFAKVLKYEMTEAAWALLKKELDNVD